MTHKLMFTKVPFNETEDFDAIDDWFTDMENDFEILIPGAKDLMKWAEKSRQEITAQLLLSETKSSSALSLCSELCPALNKRDRGASPEAVKAIIRKPGPGGMEAHPSKSMP